MHVERLELINFRSYEHAQLPLSVGVNMLLGPNGQGKTNLVEAVEYLATLHSHRVATDLPLVRAGEQQAIIRAEVVGGLADPRRLLVEVEINVGRANRARINRAGLPRSRDLIGAVRTVAFSPEDLAIVKGDPADRRDFLDTLVMTRWPRMAAVKSDYDRVLRQRTTLLKSLAGRSIHSAGTQGAAALDVWDAQLASLGGQVIAARLQTLADLVPHTAEAYQTIAPVNNEVSAVYKSGTELAGATDPAGISEALIGQMRVRRQEEIARAVSLVGPHRDDLILGIGSLPARGYASHGESWSLALALRLGSLALLRADGLEPVLILDDVFAELDQPRRERLAARIVTAEQVLVTAAVGAELPSSLAGPRYEVSLGRVQMVEVVDD